MLRKAERYLFLDEVHKYPQWAQEIKNIYDDFPELKVVFTGSSLLEILNARVETGITIPQLKLEDILESHLQEAKQINEQLKPFQYFEDYLKQGYYPFYQLLPNLCLLCPM